VAGCHPPVAVDAVGGSPPLPRLTEVAQHRAAAHRAHVGPAGGNLSPRNAAKIADCPVDGIGRRPRARCGRSPASEDASAAGARARAAPHDRATCRGVR
jgi:hypothetical protein